MKKYRTGLLVLLAIIIVFIGSLSFVSFSGAFSSDKKIDGIEDVAIKFDDFEIPKDVKVVGIGEATHGNKELQIIKREILEKVVNNGDGRAIAFEISVGEGLMLNDAIHDPDSDLVAAVGDQTYPLYDTQQIVDLLQYMKDYNMTVPYEESLMFYGVDMQDKYTGVYYLQELIKKGTDLLSKEEQDVISSIELSDFNQSIEKRDFYQGVYDRLSASDNLKQKQLALVFEMILERIDSPDLETETKEFGDNRDYCMGKNLMSCWTLEDYRGYSQIVITGHNAHVMKGSASCIYDEDDLTMGDYIDRLSGGSYFCIGTDYYNAVVDIHVAGTYDDKYERTTISTCSENTLAYQAKFMEDGRFCLDFSKITDENSKVYDIINNYNFMGIVGEGYSPSQDLYKGERMKVIATEKFDAVIYYYSITPIKTIHY